MYLTIEFFDDSFWDKVTTVVAWIIGLVIAARIIAFIVGQIFYTRPIYKKYKVALEELENLENELELKAKSYRITILKDYYNPSSQLAIINFRTHHELSVAKVLQPKNIQLHREIMTKGKAVEVAFNSCLSKYNTMEGLRVKMNEYDDRFNIFDT